MLRSSFFYLFISLLLFSCKDEKVVSIKNPIAQREAIAVRNKAIAKYQEKKYNNAFYYFNTSKSLFEKLKDSANIVYVLSQMAYIQQINGDYYGSKETLTEALPFITKKDVYSATINSLFGIADKELSNYEDAINYYKESIKEHPDYSNKERNLNNIAVVYMLQNKYDKAITIFDSILKIKTSGPNSENSKARIMDNLGYALYKKGLNEKGLLLMQKSLEPRNGITEDYGSIESNLHLSEYYAAREPQKSKKYALNAYETATKLRSIDERLEALSFLMTNEKISNNTQYAQKFAFLNDSIIKIRNNYKNKFAKIKYDSKKEKDENEKLRLERAENLVALKEAEKDKVILFATIIVTLISLVTLGIYLRKRYKHKTRLVEIKTAYDTETRIAKDIHDGLANDVFHAITYTQTQPLTNESSKENLLQKLDDIYSRVRDISRENNDINTGPNYQNNLKEMLSTYNNSQTNVIINGIEKVNWEAVEDLKKIAIQRVLHELMVNMKKHSEASLAALKFESLANIISINYTDNGKGCEESKITKNGLQNMENRISAVKGTITFDTEPNKGFKVKITMPK
ncbi:ATP-binding protein [Flavobacterium sp. KB82]|uniref:histidine kinase n=2 Tax=Flavobacterium hungaricum TaxID=2082725 RepID=A0ABR9TNE1_9FLAO|nr:tetratricopeptide repeat-containing sensor histidine kinase [Flavobacterium hungaricum]MBE8726881.1 ATP-binding protein [Flavobacterium hungaricum]